MFFSSSSFFRFDLPSFHWRGLSHGAELLPTGDEDGDGVINSSDNCIEVSNADQAGFNTNGKVMPVRQRRRQLLDIIELQYTALDPKMPTTWTLTTMAMAYPTLRNCFLATTPISSILSRCAHCLTTSR